ncbi:GNAT family N-acetyltransferase [Streptococcus pacificus]|uniref:GNAT family N-acetyltransferase n=1 Tax=Streptococcus pacificus TaxID=2740577 RepID=A0ABS0ZJ53_9STRE|nr:GNAT family N-acetyltransferase [Streptococcus pacificus]MBJ8325888.1 GNAT family N-acetyltransferase [Streptococcus pacificus]
MIKMFKDKDILDILEPLSELYQDVFQVDDETKALLVWRIKKSINDKKNPIVIAYVSDDNELLGGVFGYDYLKENYWAKQVNPYLNDDYDWFVSTFEVNELFVKQETQGQGIGGQLLNALITNVSQDNLLLSTKAVHNDPVIAFYKQHGFRVLLEQFKFKNSSQIFSVLGYQKNKVGY